MAQLPLITLEEAAKKAHEAGAAWKVARMTGPPSPYDALEKDYEIAEAILVLALMKALREAEKERDALASTVEHVLRKGKQGKQSRRHLKEALKRVREDDT